MSLLNITTNRWLSVLLAMSACVVLLEALHFYNGFPLFLADSREYIMRGLTYMETSHWSNTYVYFIGKNIEVFNSIQWVPLFQNTLTVVVLYFLITNIFQKFSLLKLIGIVFFLLFSSLPWMSNVIMSDFSTPIALLIIMVTFFYRLDLFSKVLLSMIFFFTVSCHQSHIAIIPIFIFLAICISYIAGFNRNIAALSKNLILLILLMLSSFYFEKNILNEAPKFEKTTLNKKSKKSKQSKKFKTTKQINSNTDITSGYYFVAVRMWEMGQLGKLLKSFCPDHPENYLCDPNNNYKIKVKLNKGQDRSQGNSEYQMFSQDNKQFVLACLTKPRFYYGCIKAAISRSPTLLKKTTIRPNVPIEGATFERNIKRISRKASVQYNNSKQKNGYFNYTFLEKYYSSIDKTWWFFILPITIFLFVFKSIYLKTTKLLTKKNWFLIAALCLGHVVNTVICGTFSNADNVRYSSRTIWLLNLAVILLILFIIEVKSKKEPLEE